MVIFFYFKIPHFSFILNKLLSIMKTAYDCFHLKTLMKGIIVWYRNFMYEKSIYRPFLKRMFCSYHSNLFEEEKNFIQHRLLDISEAGKFLKT